MTTAHERDDAPPAGANENDLGTDIIDGLAVGATFFVSMALLIGAVVFSAAMSDFTSLPIRMTVTGAAGCFAALIAFASGFTRILIQKMAVALVAVVFVAGSVFAGLTVFRDLGMNNYNIRSNTSFLLEDISATSPALNERTNYRAYYALHNRIAGKALKVHADFPLDDWHLLYRADLESVRRTAGINLPRTPSFEQVQSWLSAGWLEIPLANGEKLILPPIMDRNISRERYDAFAIVRVTENSYALVGDTRSPVS